MNKSIIRIVVVGLLIVAWLSYLRWNRNRMSHAPVEQSPSCVNNLRQIGYAFRIWVGANGEIFPFNVSTNAGGSMEFCARGSDGVDSNSTFHFRVMAEELNTPKVLVCPQDKSRNPAVDFSSLRAENITYRLYSGTNNNANVKTVLVVCPIDGNTLYSDGQVVSTNTAEEVRPDGRKPMQVPH